MVTMTAERKAFGERLKRQRERRGVTLESISTSTKVPVALFAGMERGDCSRWPAGLYSRSYVRAYALAIGANPDETVEDFIAAFGSAAPVEGGEAAPKARQRRGPALRLGMVEEPAVDLARMGKRAVAATLDLGIASGLAYASHALLGTSVVTTVAAGLGYHALSRLVSDESLVVWAVRRIVTGSRPVEVESEAEVGVGDAASTAA